MAEATVIRRQPWSKGTVLKTINSSESIETMNLRTESSMVSVDVRDMFKKCTKLKPKQLKCLKPNKCVCSKCLSNRGNIIISNSDVVDETYVLNESPKFNVTDVDLNKYDNMVFNPLRFDSDFAEKSYSGVVNDGEKI